MAFFPPSPLLFLAPQNWEAEGTKGGTAAVVKVRMQETWL